MKKIISVVLLVGLIVILGGCRKSEAPKQTVAVPKIKVIATVFPAYEFVRQVGGDKIDVSMLVPAGAEPHAWEPTAKELIKIKEAKIVFFHGAGLETWAGKVLSKENLGSTQAVEISSGIPVLKPDDQEHDGHGAHHGHNHSHTTDMDPHMWLDPVLAKQEVRSVAEALASLDTEHKEYYLANADRYIAELDTLHNDYLRELKDVKQRKFITNHSAFGYLAARYNLEQLPIMGLAPDAEPTPDRMAKIVKTVRENKIRYVFSETIISPKLAETIARETGAQVLVLHPVDQLTETELKSGQTYLSLMRANLANLKKALSE